MHRDWAFLLRRPAQLQLRVPMGMIRPVMSAGTRESPGGAADSGPLPGARAALVLLLSINLFNYIDRTVLAAVEPRISETFFGASTPRS